MQPAKPKLRGATEPGADERVMEEARPAESLARRQEDKGRPDASAGAGAPGALGGSLAKSRVQEASKVTTPPAEAQLAEFAPAAAPQTAAPAAPAPAQRADAAEPEARALPASPQAKIERSIATASAGVRPPAQSEGQAAAAIAAAPVAQAARAEASNEARTGAASARDVAQPAGQPQWRVGREGRIDRSDDGGRSWLPQVSGVAADLFAFDAVTSTTAWVVGARGVVLVTTEGRAWQRVSTPADVDLVGVRARDASAAVVTARDGRRFATTDGGRTWKQQ
jgi:hypothetical protein